MFGFYIDYGYLGYVGNGVFIEFATIQEYEEYIIERIIDNE